MRYLEHHGVVLDGHDASPTDARARAAAFLTDAGVDLWLADTSAAIVQRAWWAGAEIGFCGSEHPAAEPVAVVAIDLPPAEAAKVVS